MGDADEWKLIPSAWRDSQNGLQTLIHKISEMNLPIPNNTHTKGHEHKLELRCYLEWTSAEREALYQFACVANELGFKVDAGSYQRNRSPMIFKSRSPFLFEESSPKVAIIAQHHGIPTRLLDWSYNPMVAAFFAVAPEFRPNTSKKICVWALDTSHLAGQNPDEKNFGRFRVLVWRPQRSTNQYLHSQSGILTEISNQSALVEHFLEHQAWPSLEYVISLVESEKPILVSYTLEVNCADNLLILLDREGINHATIMPTLDNVAKTVKERWKRDL